MRRREGMVKRLHTQSAGVRGETLPIEDGDRSQTPNVAIVQRPAVAESERERRISSFALRQRTLVEEQRPREAGLHDEVVAGREVEDDQLRAAPYARDGGANEPMRQFPGFHSAQDVRARDDDRRNGPSDDLAIEVPGDRFGLR